MKKKAVIIIAILVAIVLSFIGGQTYSKYVTEVRGDGTAQIATWDFKVNGQKEEVQTISLGSTYDSSTLVNGKIAPGTEGNFQIIVDATGSDVGIDYKIKFSDETTKPTNLKFYYQEVEYNSILELGEALSGTINADDENKSKTFDIKWKWNYETGSNPTEIASNDKIDTQNAQEITNYEFDVIVSGTQVVPQA